MNFTLTQLQTESLDSGWGRCEALLASFFCKVRIEEGLEGGTHSILQYSPPYIKRLSRCHRNNIAPSRRVRTPNSSAHQNSGIFQSCHNFQTNKNKGNKVTLYHYLHRTSTTSKCLRDWLCGYSIAAEEAHGY